MAKPNYQHARKQKELARKARQQEKQQRRAVRQNSPNEAAPVSEGPLGIPDLNGGRAS